MIPALDMPVGPLPYEGFDIPHLLAHRAADRGAHPFLVWEPFDGPGRTWSYAEFAADVATWAGGLAARGVRSGDAVLLHLDNCPELLLGWFASAHLGAVAVTTNTRSTLDELTYFASKVEPAAVITEPRHAGLVAEAAPGAGWIWLAPTDADGTVSPGAAPDATSSTEALFAASPAELRPPDPRLPLWVQFTSGTTARPKGVVWSHANGLWGAQGSAWHEGLRPDDRHHVHLPLFHTNAMTYSVLASLWAGGTVVLQPRFSASRFWEVAVRTRCTWTSTARFCLNVLSEREVPTDHTFRQWGAAVCSPPTDELFGVTTIGWWGMSETITHGIVGHTALPNRPLSMGRASPLYRIAIRDDEGRPVPPGETGALLVHGVRGVSLFSTYLHDEAEATASFDADGWFRTGDLVTLLDDGFVRFSDRDKDMMKVGGENVAASEIERVIATVAGVAEAAVVGQRHRYLDEVPVVFVIPRDAPSDDLGATILAACAEQLAPFKVPVAVHLVAELPRSLLGKVAKAQLRGDLPTVG